MKIRDTVWSEESRQKPVFLNHSKRHNQGLSFAEILAAEIKDEEDKKRKDSARAMDSDRNRERF